MNSLHSRSSNPSVANADDSKLSAGQAGEILHLTELLTSPYSPGELDSPRAVIAGLGASGKTRLIESVAKSAGLKQIYRNWQELAVQPEVSIAAAFAEARSSAAANGRSFLHIDSCERIVGSSASLTILIQELDDQKNGGVAVILESRDAKLLPDPLQRRFRQPVEI